MKPQLLHIFHEAACSFSARQDMTPNINNRWHYHAELELICFHRSGGTQFIGDHIMKFGPGDIVLLGPNLPHYWMYDQPAPSETEAEDPYATVIHFREDFLGTAFLQIPECKSIRTLLELSRQGLLIPEDERQPFRRHIAGIPQKEGISRIISLVECLAAIADRGDYRQLSSLGFRYHEPNSDNERLNNVYRYILRNFRKKITLPEISAHAGLNPGSFCRYFKLKTGKTFTQLLVEIRIGYACKLLLDNTLDVKTICFEAGFNNFSCFHKGFKQITGFTPQTYKNKHIKR
jgi:AraC-like DNA-binding protein